MTQLCVVFSKTETNSKLLPKELSLDCVNLLFDSKTYKCLACHLLIIPINDGIENYSRRFGFLLISVLHPNATVYNSSPSMTWSVQPQPLL